MPHPVSLSAADGDSLGCSDNTSWASWLAKVSGSDPICLDPCEGSGSCFQLTRGRSVQPGCHAGVALVR